MERWGKERWKEETARAEERERIRELSMFFPFAPSQDNECSHTRAQTLTSPCIFQHFCSPRHWYLHINSHWPMYTHYCHHLWNIFRQTPKIVLLSSPWWRHFQSSGGWRLPKSEEFLLVAWRRAIATTMWHVRFIVYKWMQRQFA